MKMNLGCEPLNFIFDKIIAALDTKCPHCASETISRNGSSINARCSWSSCNRRLNLLVETPFYRAMILKILFSVLYECCVLAFVTPKLEKYWLSVSALSRKIKPKIIKMFYEQLKPIDRARIVFEIDELKFEKVKHRRGF